MFALYFHFGISIVEIKNETQIFFKSLASKKQEYDSWKEPQGYDKLLYKTIIESFSKNLHTGEKVFYSCYMFEGLQVVSFQTE